MVQATFDTHQFERKRREDEARTGMGVAPNQPIRGLAVIDTGAQLTAIVREVADRLALPSMGPMSIAPVRTAYSTERATSVRAVYLRVHVDGLAAVGVKAVDVAPLGTLDGEPILALLGANYLDFFDFARTGHVGFTLTTRTSPAS